MKGDEVGDMAIKILLCLMMGGTLAAVGGAWLGATNHKRDAVVRVLRKVWPWWVAALVIVIFRAMGW
jgi:hypothetical protein